MSNSYNGMHWLKCDLQMQTPADVRHWTGEKMVAGQEAEAAKAFAEACNQSGLDVVGITDHNFLSKDFFPHLQAAFDELERQSGHKITVFPGFEFEAAGVGRGVHVLCLFEPGSDLALIDSILTECGIGYHRVTANDELAKSDLNLKTILQLVQNKHGGIVIMPHAMSNDGIFDNHSISEWLQKDQFTNPDLLAVEVPKPVGQMSSAFQKLFRSGEDCLQDWKRIRPIATLMSSDNKKLIEADAHGKPTPNSIGYRYSWIKMSRPSIESLRQAFLDHESRIILPEDVLTDVHPRERYKHPRIVSIKIRNTLFLADQEIHFSPNFNCVIGGRGSGKSTVLEYLRILLGKDEVLGIDKGTQERIGRVRGTTNNADTEIQVTWESGAGVVDTIVWRHGEKSVAGLELTDPKTYFKSLPIQFFSQQQLNRLTESKAEEGSIRQAERLLELIDGFAASDLQALAVEESKLKRQIDEAFAKLRKAENLKADLRRFQQEKQELDRQYQARQEIQEDAHRYQQLRSEINYLQSLQGQAGKEAADILALANQFAETHQTFSVENSPNKIWLEELDNKVKAAKVKLANAVSTAIEDYKAQCRSFKEENAVWTDIKTMHDGAEVAFLSACEAKGLTQQDLGLVQEISEQRTKKQTEIERTTDEITELVAQADSPEELMAQLHQTWKRQFAKRQEAATRANELAVLSEGCQRFIEVSAQFQQSRESFTEIWNKLNKNDGRSKLGKRWDMLGDSIYQAFTLAPETESPWQIVQSYLDGDQLEAEQKFKEIWPDFVEFLKNNPVDWCQTRCSRAKDTVDLKLLTWPINS